jgi:sulfoquinovose isomerase
MSRDSGGWEARAAGTADPATAPEVGSAAWRTQECNRLLDFGSRFPHPDGGAAWLDEFGLPELTRPVHTWITARMLHVYSLGHLLGRPGDAALAETALTGLLDRLQDSRLGGWVSRIDPSGAVPDEKTCYTHAFVVLAASSATLAGLTGASELLTEALTVWDEKFFDPQANLYVDAWDRSFTTLDPYRGVNANMHAVEALLAAADAAADRKLRQRALSIAERVIRKFARPQQWRIPEHYDAYWTPQPEHHRHQPDHAFQPYGATVGHGLEWARLLLHLEAALGATAPDWLLSAAVALFDRAVHDGWAADGAAGFIYTTDWAGEPVVRDRMHWVVAEAISAAAALHARTSEPQYAEYTATWWRYVDRYIIDHRHGSWFHQLDPSNQPTATVWPGKPDLYHAIQATLIPGLPLAPVLAATLATAQATPIPGNPGASSSLQHAP